MINSCTSSTSSSPSNSGAFPLHFSYLWEPSPIFEMHGSEATWQQFDLTPLLKDIASLLQTPNVRIEVQAPPQLTIDADADRLRQALENVLSNAMQHSPKGTTVSIQAQVHAEDHRVLLAVRDQGSGIAPELQSTLFEPFRSGATSQGLGLGLYLASQIALAHGGELSLDTTYHNGACFLFSLPLDGNPSER